MSPSPQNVALSEAESGIATCPNYSKCSAVANCTLELSQIEPEDERRGSRDPRVLLVTEAPDSESSQGSAYQGPTSQRIMSLFRDERYGISLADSASSNFPLFLKENDIYVTSAVKCEVEMGQAQGIDYYVITSCRERYLQPQIDAMGELDLMLAFGSIATSSLLGRGNIDDFTSMIGRMGTGILNSEQGYDPPLVLLPHPSGNNPYFNPPIINPETPQSLWGYRIRFRKALSFVRDVLREIEYEVREGPPNSWVTPDGLDQFG